jgi:predicted  nucleic acid-binding Zn-ribbon protein
MHPQLILLLELQDLRSQHRELAAGSGTDEMESTQFGIDVTAAAAELRKKIGELEDALSPPMRSRYDRIVAGLERVVVPVINGMCYGCFVTIPTSTAREQDPNAELRSCQHCGRFIYILK